MEFRKEYLSTFSVVFCTVLAEIFIGNPIITSALVLLGGALCIFSKYKSSQKIQNLQLEAQLLVKGMSEASQVISNLGKDGERKFEILDTDTELCHTILSVDADMKKFNEAEHKRNWGIEGLAKFSELLRSHEKNIHELSEGIISNLVRYVAANQGGIFIHQQEGDDEYLKLTASYAYDKVRIREKRIEIGQGQVGQCYLEKETVCLLDVPQGYVSITSGIGEATPENVILIPMKLNEKVYGVIELASFQVFLDYEIRFLEQLAENIASMFASMRNNEKTSHLLEEAQGLATELQSREEEMRQNVEQLSATQEEMQRKQSELDGIIGAINNAMGVVELNTEGEIIYANNMISNALGYSEDEMRNLSYEDLIGHTDPDGALLKKIQHVQLEASHYELKSRTGQCKWLTISFSPIKDYMGSTRKILALTRDITARKLQEIEFEKLSLVADNTHNAVIISDKHGRIEYVNKGFTEMTGYDEQEVRGKKPGDFLQGKDTDQQTVHRVSEALARNEAVYEEILNYTKHGESYWISMTINPVFNDEGQLQRYISIQADITETKMRAVDYSSKLEAISKSNAIVEFDLNGEILDVNDNFLEIFGYDRSEVVGRHHSIFMAEEDKNSSAYIDFWKDLRKGEVFNGEFVRVKKDGEQVWLKGIYNPIYDFTGKPYKVIKFVTDVTHQKILKFEKRKQEVELENQMQAINKTIASAEFDLDGYLKRTNEIFDGITGIELTATSKVHYSDIIPPNELLKPQTKLMWNNLKEGKFFSGEFKLKDPKGKELWLVGTFNPINDIEGNPYKVMMYAQFTTQEKEKQKELNGVVGAMKNTAPIMELHPDGTYKNGNALFMDFFGYNRIELRRKPFADFLSDHSPQVMRDVLTRLKKEAFIEVELKYVNSDGETKVFKSTFSSIYDLEDKLSKIVVIMIERVVVSKPNHHERY
ncbi:PAS domain S-box protein [Fulvivirga sediminis]|uniref:PAS domain S-box protein n=1 Tax=Fulvivirga sediminis TaxID=2803949 RepID=A0A937F802_9BACT|nr:PAS domain S-box protein [Fulvivirga sediminis]MBL3655753.1 PAS domain S-box protein [Fulvivirga sediminis]